MKKIILSSFLAAAFLSSNAQYQIQKTNAPKIGDIYDSVTDTIPQVTKGGSGASQIWDLTNFDFDVSESVIYSDPSTFPESSSYPEADVYLDGFVGLYIDVTNTKMEAVGAVVEFGERSHSRFKNPETLLVFPSAFQSAYKDTSAFLVSFPLAFEIDANTRIDSGRVDYNNKKDVLFDAFGQVETPLAKFPNALRERAYTINQTKFEVYVCFTFAPLPEQCSWQDASTFNPDFSSAPDTTIIYNWYSMGLSSPIATIVYEANDANVRSASFNNDPNYLGITENKLSASAVYPNPASNMINIKTDGNISSYIVTDVAGKIMLSASTSESTVDVSSLAKGNYIISVSTDKGVSNTMFAVAR